MQSNETRAGLERACEIANSHMEKLYDRLIYKGQDRDTALKCHASITTCEVIIQLFRNDITGELSPAATLGQAGGKKSKRVLTPYQAKAMVESREKKKREKG